MALFLALSAVLIFTVPVYAGIYSYKDETGTIHFTDDLSKIPKKFRSPEGGLKKHKESRPSSISPQQPPVPSLDLGFPSLKKKEYKVPLLSTSGGNFFVETVFNNSATLQMMVDTGASIITISEKAAGEMGLDYGPSSPQLLFNTAGGQVWMPLVVLDSVKVGDAEVRDVEASINSQMQGDGLLGMSFLSDFKFEMDRARSQMILKSLDEPGEVVWDGKPEAWWRAKFEYYNDRISEYERRVALLAVRSPEQAAME
ncbi:MAG: TIGR02281 family clan AA aspartic protease, partial [Nitrospinaceae bacterium]